MNRYPDLDVAAVSAAYESRVRAECGGTLPRALLLSGRLDPQQWQLEWNLAEWLGSSLDVDPVVRLEISLSNVLGLACVVLLDDLQDGDLDGLGEAEARSISASLYSAALEPYRKLFPPESDFWPELDARMSEWRTATQDAGSSISERHELAKRGAPLKISAYATCLVAGRQDLYDTVGRCIDEALTAMVLYDHFIDWRGDLAEGRWNAFVGGATLESDVVVAMLTTDLVSAHFARIGTHLDEALRLARTAGVAGLANHLESVAAELGAQGAAEAARYEALGERARQLVFGSRETR